MHRRSATFRPGRRTFLRRAGTGAAALFAASLHPRLFAGTSGQQPPESGDPTEDLLFMSTVKLAQWIRERKVSAVEVVRAHYARIDAVNPKINAVVAFCRERALAEAAERDALLARGRTIGPLHGVPMTIKDSFDTAGVVSTGGTLGRRDFVPGADATVVARLRAAGAILLGKSNTPEFTLGGGGKGTVNLIHGVTRNPYHLDHQPSGSSGGAGAIVAAGGASFDIGTDYGGSIRGPAYANGIAGLKPTYGAVPRTGHIVGYGGPFDNFQEAGPLARRVEDLSLLMRVIEGPDDWDCAMVPIPMGDPAAVDLRRLRVAFYTTNGQVDPSPEVREVVTRSVGFFEALGCAVTEDRPPKMRELAEVRGAFSGANGRDHMRRLLARHGTTQASPGLRLDGEEKTSAELTRLVEEMDAIKSEQLAWLERYDLILCPGSHLPPIPLDHERPRDWTGTSYTSQYNTTGWPAGVVRVGTADKGLPLGVQVVGQPWRDDVVLAALAHIEGRSGGFQKPPL